MIKKDKPSILVVEDEQTLLKAVTYALDEAGFNVSSAIDGDSAMEKVREKPDLVLLDIIIPRKSGLEVLKEMKADPALSDIPVLLLTNLSDDDSVSQGIALGARGYLVKSNYDLESVVAKVKEVLKMK